MTHGAIPIPLQIKNQDTARDSGVLLWVMFLAMDAREPDMCRVAGRLCRALTDGDARSLGVLTRSFPPGLLAPCPADQVGVRHGYFVTWQDVLHGGEGGRFMRCFFLPCNCLEVSMYALCSIIRKIFDGYIVVLQISRFPLKRTRCHTCCLRVLRNSINGCLLLNLL